jgi:prophage tail gpP-like protein
MSERFYSVQSGDTFESIALRVYGVEGKESLIKQANINLKDLNQGDLLIIPFLSEDRRPQKKLNKTNEDITIFIKDLEIVPLSARIVTSIDNMVFAWSASFPWEPGDSSLDQLLVPYTYPEASIYIGNERIINGFLYAVAPQKTIDGSFMDITGYSFTADVMDSELKPPFEINKISLLDRIKQLISPLGIDTILDSGVNTGGVFDRVTADTGETIGKHLMKLATQRGVLLSSNEDGNLLITKATTEDFEGLITEGISEVMTWKAKYDGRKRFNSYRAYGQSPGAPSKEAVSIDQNIPVTRFTSFNAPDTIKGELQTVADWRKTSKIKEALQLSITLPDWFAESGRRWKHNTIVSLISPTLFISVIFGFLVKSVEYILNERGRSTKLNLVPPQVFTGGDLVDPWGVL